MYRFANGRVEVLLVHPGGPLWRRKDAGAWFVPKGELHENEDPLEAARREFREETSLEPAGPFVALGEVRHKSGKRVIAWAFEGDCDPSSIRSNTFRMEWPPRSGKEQEFPEIDRAEFLQLEQARQKMHEAESVFLDRLARHLTPQFT
jgi:predicted NUDIX family NTP pyrophosphohydrolase